MPSPGPGSDGENGEKPVREQLRQTKIDKTGKEPDHGPDDETTKPQTASVTPAVEDASAKKSEKKRSLEEEANADLSSITGESGKELASTEAHTRKRTREDQETASMAEQPQVENGDSKMEGASPPKRAKTPEPAKDEGMLEATITSPRKKRSRETLDHDEEPREQKARRSSSEERSDRNGEKKPENSEKPVFGASLKPKPLDKPSEKPQTSSSAFAASGFASLSGSSSPFGNLGSASSPETKGEDATSKPNLASFASPGKQSSTFGSSFAGGKSTFASTSNSTSAFGGALSGTAFGGGFSGSFGGGAKLSSFAAPVGDVKLGSSKAEKPFGTKEESGDESENASESDGEPAGDDASRKEEKEKEDVKSPKFHVQEVNTGEDNEDSVYTNRAKLFQFHPDSKSWKERGVGPLKVNVEKTSSDSADDSKADTEAQEARIEQMKARFVMRHHATHKVILNAPIYKEMLLSEQTKTQLTFGRPNEAGKMDTYLLKMSKEEDVKLFVKVVTDLQGKM